MNDFLNAGFSVFGTSASENKLVSFLKENYPSVIKDNEIDVQELKAIAGLPVAEKTNGYGLNFVGRNFARAKYAQKTDKEVRLNRSFSVAEMNTQNLVLKGDNLDSLKILKNHYSGKIKCIYIDPPYNTTSDEFVYPDKFDKEEAEVLGLANLSESDFARMDFSFKTKKSHNGWLAFMYPRLLLARDLLRNDGVIFISIDDNEQANLKLLCDDVFGEENFYSQIIVRANSRGHTYKQIAKTHEYIFVFTKTEMTDLLELEKDADNSDLNLVDNVSSFNIRELRNRNPKFGKHNRKDLFYPIYVNPNAIDKDGFNPVSLSYSEAYCIKVEPFNSIGIESCWRWGKPKTLLNISENTLVSNLIAKKKRDGDYNVYEKYRKTTYKPKSIWDDNKFLTETGTVELKQLGFNHEFNFPKPIELIKQIVQISTEDDSFILDFFAGSGTTGHAVMQLNAEDGGNRKFILCQEDRKIDKDKPAYQFCIDNNLPAVISSITIERLKRAGEKIASEIEAENNKIGLFEEDKKQVPDIGFKVFDSVEAPKLKVDDEGQIQFPEIDMDTISRIYNMMFTVGLDEPTQVPEVVKEDCIYKIGNHYYITNSEKISNDDFSDALKNGKVFIDGWTASLNGTLQNYKEDVKIVF